MDRGRLIEFERVDVITPMIYPAQPRLVVTGKVPTPGTVVSLVPLQYVSQPPYAGIQVVGTLDPRAAAEAGGAAEYSVELDLRGISGSEGVEVIGAGQTERVEVPPPA